MSDLLKQFEIRQVLSDEKLKKLRAAMSAADEVSGIKNLTVFAAGSYARGDAGEFSDIDLFFVANGDEGDKPARLKELRLFSKVIEISDSMDFPPPSNDGQFLDVFTSESLLKNLGGPLDDHSNSFTTRMLALLESKYVEKEVQYNQMIETIVTTYFRDYPDHPEGFVPTFLVNDIIRFWKTLCLNYENKRNKESRTHEEKVWQRIKNFKLRYSRLLTCFASVCYITDIRHPVTPEMIVEMSKLSPRERLAVLASKNSEYENRVKDMFAEYSWFLEQTARNQGDIFAHFENDENAKRAFDRARTFGDLVYELVNEIGKNTERMRYLVV